MSLEDPVVVRGSPLIGGDSVGFLDRVQPWSPTDQVHRGNVAPRAHNRRFVRRYDQTVALEDVIALNSASPCLSNTGHTKIFAWQLTRADWPRAICQGILRLSVDAASQEFAPSPSAGQQ